MTTQTQTQRTTIAPRYYDIIVAVAQRLNDQNPPFQRCLKVLSLQRMKRPELPEIDTRELRRAWQEYKRVRRINHG